MMVITATLCHILNDGKLLLIKKKRGVGAGFWNAAGGKVEEGEDVREAAVREVKEEVGITPIEPDKIGVLDFYFGKEHFMHVHVFLAGRFSGHATETDEALPRWFAIEEIPYRGMWADDVHWMPLMMEGKKFVGKFYFDSEGKNLLRHVLKEVTDTEN